MMNIKKAKCKICSEPFVKRGMSHIYCSPKCAIFAIENKKITPKKIKDVLTQKSKKERPKSFYVHKLQDIFNKYIRLRDIDEPCISCGKHRSKYHAGHYLSVGGHSNLRFDESNVHKQCAYCNIFLSGNLLNYRIGLINKIGLSKVEELESNHDAKKYIVSDLNNMISDYKNKVKCLLLKEASK